MSTTEELPGRNSSGSGLERREYGHGDPGAMTMQHPICAKVGTNFKQQSLGQYGSLATLALDFYLWVLHPVAHLSNLVSYDAVNRNKVSIRQLSLLFLPTHYMFRPLQAIFR
jgi:hypothetical protein